MISHKISFQRCLGKCVVTKSFETKCLSNESRMSNSFDYYAES